MSGVSASNINRYMKGGVAPKPDALVKIARALDVSIDWLLTGEGRGPDDEPETAAELGDFFAAPIVGTAAGGAPLVADYVEIDAILLHRAIRKHLGGELRACWVLGNSMEPMIKSGSLVVFKLDRELSLDRLDHKTAYVINVPDEGGATVKRLRYREPTNELDFIPVNPDHQVTSYRAQAVKILGPVVGVVWQEM